MKCIIRAEPRFYIDMTLDLALLLQQLARRHYDRTCRDHAEVGGFIYGWVNSLALIDEQDKCEGEVMATFRELDHLLSFMESPPPLSMEKALLLKEFKQLIHTSLQTSNRKLRQFEYTIGELSRPQRLAILKSRNPVDDGGTYDSVEDMLDEHNIPKYDVLEIKEPLNVALS